jgi:glycosyltransferase involved in cell wall biosynthesis
MHKILTRTYYPLLNHFIYALCLKLGKPHWYFFCQPKVLLNKTVIIVGTGNVGKNLLALLQLFNKKIVLVDDKAARYPFSVLNISVLSWQALATELKNSQPSIPIVLTMFNGVEQAKSRLTKLNALGQLICLPHEGNTHIAFTTSDSYARKLAKLSQAELTANIPSRYQSCVLWVEHNLGGGTYQFSKRQISAQISDDSEVLVLTYCEQAFHLSDAKTGCRIHSFYSFSALENTLKQVGYKQIVLSNLFSFVHPLSLLNLLLGLRYNKLFCYIHDYFVLCQSYSLWNDKNHYCGLPSVETCQRCILQNPHIADKSLPITQWRKAWQQVLLQANKVIVFSTDSEKKLLATYPNLHNVELQAHSLDYFQPIHLHTPTTNCEDNELLTIGVLGPVTLKKGEQALLALHAYLLRQNINWQIIIIGQASSQIQVLQRVKVTGRYEIKSLDKLCEKANIDVFFFTSLCSETFSFSVSEIMAMRYPLLCFDLGAQADKVATYENGVVVDPEASAEQVFLALKRLAKLDTK